MHQHLRKLDFSGALECGRYAFMPNKLNYCGGDKNHELFDYTVGFQADPHIESLLSKFDTMYPYLRFIAQANSIADPFDRRVVESYWLGNDLLGNIDMSKLYGYFIDELKLKQKFNSKILERVIGAIPKGAVPHHNFHVFNIPKRTGHYPVEHSLETMDKCRISWGQILKIEEDLLEVATQPLELKEKRLTLSEPVTKKVRYKFSGKSFVKEPKTGDWVSMHWDWACDRISLNQAADLEKYTRMSMQLNHTN